MNSPHQSRAYSPSYRDVYDSSQVEPLELESNHSEADPYHTRSTKVGLSRKQMISMVACMFVIAIGLLIGLLAGLWSRGSDSTDHSEIPVDVNPSPPIRAYTAASVQYMPYSSGIANEAIQSNLAAYSSIVDAAADSNVDIVVFPEGGLGYISVDVSKTNSTVARPALSKYCEVFPPVGSTPYNAMDSTFNRQLVTLSSLANKHSITLVANMCQREICTPGQSADSFRSQSYYPFARSACPDDGQYLWNSNVAFHPNGSIAAVYAKSHLFDSIAIDSPRPMPVSFVSAFGVQFGMMTSFDIEFSNPQSSLLKDGVQHWLHTCSWQTNQPPQLTSNMIFNAWADRYGVNLVTANQLEQRAQGGGIFQAGASQHVYFDPDMAVGPGQFVTLIDRLPVSLPRAAAPLELPNEPYSLLPSWPEMITVSSAEDCEVGAVSMQGSCVFLQPTTEAQSVSVNNGYVTCRAHITPTSTGSVNETELSTYAIFASENVYDYEDTPSSLFMGSCFVMRCVASDNSTMKQCSEGYAATTSFDGLQVLAGLDCDRFAPIVADSTSGVNPAGIVLPMLATERANIENNSEYSFEYAGKFDGLCWWSMNLTHAMNAPLFSMGVYAVEGQSNL